jgi:O-antigen/teichoic acid export membrane protein
MEEPVSRDHPHETRSERLDRNVGELLQELRVAQAGVQILFAFLLTLAFTARFAEVSTAQRAWYVTTLLLCTASTALLIGPVSFHRLVFRRGERAELVTVANIMAIGGIAFLLAAIVSSLGLIIDFVYSWVPALVLSGAALIWFVLLWYVVPVVSYRRDRARRPHISPDNAAN